LSTADTRCRLVRLIAFKDRRLADCREFPDRMRRDRLRVKLPLHNAPKYGRFRLKSLHFSIAASDRRRD
jgi:hypothetical protein